MPRDEHRQPRQLAIVPGFLHLAVIFGVCVAYSAAFAATELVPVAMAVALYIGLINLVYLGIYKLEYYEVIDRECCDNMIESVTNLCPGFKVNVFAQNAVVRLWPMNVLVLLERLVARRVALAEGDQEEV